MADALVLIFARNAFYKRLYFYALTIFSLMLIIMGILIWIITFLLQNPTPPLYFATDSVGRLIQFVPLSQPNMTMDEVIAWTKSAMEEAYSYDYVNYRAQLQSAQKYFTQYGWTRYMDALTASDNLLAVSQRKMIANATVVEQPQLIKTGILDGAYAWQFKMPILITYLLPPYDDKPESKYSNPLIISVIVQRQSVLQSYKGLGIVQIVGSMSTISSQPQQLTNEPAG